MRPTRAEDLYYRRCRKANRCCTLYDAPATYCCRYLRPGLPSGLGYRPSQLGYDTDVKIVLAHLMPSSGVWMSDLGSTLPAWICSSSTCSRRCAMTARTAPWTARTAAQVRLVTGVSYSVHSGGLPGMPCQLTTNTMRALVDTSRLDPAYLEMTTSAPERDGPSAGLNEFLRPKDDVAGKASSCPP